MYLTILNYTNGSVIIETDPAGDSEDFNYEDYIINLIGNVDYHYIVCSQIDMEI